MKLLSKGSSNAKTTKNNLPTYILYLAPHKQNSVGVNVCPNASQGCISGCLFTAGRAAIFPMINRARIRKTDFYLKERNSFLQQLVKELTAINNRGIKTAIRLNGTSDLDFHAIVKNRLGVDLFDFKNLIFYDYTKIKGKAEKYSGHKKYTVTFSRSETNDADCIELLKDRRCNVSVVFDHRKPMPKLWNGFKVINGDTADDIMISRKGYVLGLKAKGKAKKDNTGFVVRQ